MSRRAATLLEDGGAGMYRIAMAILGVGALVLSVLGWHHLAHLLRQSLAVALAGWLLGMGGLALMVGRRKRQPRGRLAVGLVLAALGLALLAVPRDGQGVLTGIRIGLAGSVVAVMPHVWRLYRHPARELPRSAAPSQEAF
ncbi:MAG: hypothetical protein OWU84_06775 [Firmicutes bacterium]|nr:hypothetical protein [Bacillota bacterium]